MDYHAMAISSLRKYIEDQETDTTITYKADGTDLDFVKEEFNKLIDEGKIKDLEISTEVGHIPEHFGGGDIEFTVLSAKVA